MSQRVQHTTMSTAASGRSGDGPGVTGAESLIRSLEAAGTEHVFGIPGGAILPAYDPMMDSSMRHVLVRHEQGAGHAAQGYAAASGRVGVCMATSGPGATNLVTPLADAHMDSVPMVADDRPGRCQRCDRYGRVPGGRHPRHHDAGHQAQLPGHRPGPDPAHHRRGVLHRLDRPPGAGARRRRPRTRCTAQTTFTLAHRAGCCPATARSPSPHAKQVREAARLILASPAAPSSTSAVAVIRSGASTESSRRLAELTGMPVVTTLMALGAFPDSHPQHLGMPGMHGTVAAVAGLQKQRPDHQPRSPVRRPGHRQPRLVRPAAPRWCTPTSTRRRSARTGYTDVPIVGDAREVMLRPHRGRCCASRLTPGTSGDYEAWVSVPGRRDQAEVPPRLRRARPTMPSPRSTSSSGSARSPGPRRSTSPASASTRCGRRTTSRYENPRTWINSGGPRHHGVLRAGGDGGQGRSGLRPPCGPSTATAASR